MDFDPTINERIERYGKVITAIEKGEDLYKADSPLQLASVEKAKAVEVLNGDVYELITRLRSYITLRLDSALSGGGATLGTGNDFSRTMSIPLDPLADGRSQVDSIPLDRTHCCAPTGRTRKNRNSPLPAAMLENAIRWLVPKRE